MFKTIAAISTPVGEGAIGIIRISGSDSLNIINKIFRPKNRKTLKSFSVNFGYIEDENEIVDEVIVNVMLAPNTYTKEDIIEINCHGGYFITNKILGIVLKNGAIAADKGEFTKRAFINGRISLNQAESIIDIISAKSDKGLSNSVNQLIGKLNEEINEIKQLLLDVISHVNVVIDYPEEGIEEPLPKNLKENLKKCQQLIKILIDTYEKGKKIKNGIKTVIIGKPNVGKSSILNALLRQERAIVTHIPGTTRDTIEEIININGISLVLTDTAGIRETNDFIENIGIKKSKTALKNSDLILFVLDSSKELSNEDNKLMKTINIQKTIFIINKIDLENKLDANFIKNLKNVVYISAKYNEKLNDLENKIYSTILSKDIQNSENKVLIDNIRHKSALEKAYNGIKDVFETIENNYPLDLIAIDLKTAIDGLYEITGEITSEDILENIFSKFCVGK